jgi:hypothetical protein
MQVSTVFLLRVATYVLTLVLGSMLVVLGYYITEHTRATDRITKMEAEVRTAHGKRLDAEERHQDELEAARSTNSVELWKAQQELAACQKGAAK